MSDNPAHYRGYGKTRMMMDLAANATDRTTVWMPGRLRDHREGTHGTGGQRQGERLNTQRIDGPGVQALHTQDAMVKWSEWMDKCSVTYPPRMATRRHFTIDGVYVHAGKREGMWLGAVSFGFNVNFPIRDAIKIFVDECEKHNHKVKEIVFE